MWLACPVEQEQRLLRKAGGAADAVVSVGCEHLGRHIPGTRHRHIEEPPTPPQSRPVWLYLRFTLSYRDVEEVLTERGLERLLQKRAPLSAVISPKTRVTALPQEV